MQCVEIRGAVVTEQDKNSNSFSFALAKIRIKNAGRYLAWLVRGISASLRYEVIDNAGVLTAQPREPVMWVFWHNRLFTVPYLKQRWFPHIPGCVLTSPSGDGQVIADVCADFDLEAARGSSSKPEKGMSALIKLAEKARAGFDIGITPDGPRGPCYSLNPGPVKLAQLTGMSIMPVHVQYDRPWRFRTWDAFQLPRPFSRARVILGEKISVPRRLNEEQFEQHRAALEAALREGAVDLE
jgi:Kdo2-lipid IVA 3' secondary acyltransferase